MKQMKKIVRLLGPILVVSALIIVGWWLVSNAHFAVFEPTGWVASQQKKILIFALILSAIVVTPVFIMLGLFAWKYREGNKKARYDPEWHKNTVLELLWWGIPVLIIVILSGVAWKTSHELDPYREIASKNSTIQVEVVALQWKWLFIYPELGVASVNQLAMPVNHPVSFRLTADAPMSAFWVPQLGSQIYSMNGMASQIHLLATKTGTFKGYNTNINGEGYAKMTFDTVSMSENDFSTWTKKAAASHKVLTTDTFDTLVAPSYVDSPTFYALKESDIFDTIVMKYMHGTMSESTKSATKKSEDTDASSHSMDGMEGMDHSMMKGME